MAGWEPMLEVVARERYPHLVARALLLTRSRADAEDLVQDALVSTFGGRARFDTAAQAEQYVRRRRCSGWPTTARRPCWHRRPGPSSARTPAAPCRGSSPAEPCLAARRLRVEISAAGAEKSTRRVGREG